MEEEIAVKIIFDSDEIGLYTIIQQHCIKKNLSISDYIKDIIKKDLAWGQFAKRRRSHDGNKKKRRYYT